MPFLQQQLAFMPMQLCFEPALSCPLHDLQSLVQRGQTLFNLARDLTCPGQEGAIIGGPYFGPGGAVSHRTAMQKQYSLLYIAIFDFDPAARDGSHRTAEREALLGCDGNELACPLLQGYVVSDERKQYVAECQARRQRRRMSQPPSLSNYCAALCYCLIRKAEIEQDNRQVGLRYHVQVGSGLICKRAVGDWIIKDTHLFQVRSGGRKPAANEPVSTGG